MSDKVKIFLSYHKETPCYKSDFFQPIHVGALFSDKKIEFALSDADGDNISELNPYYCELTGHYWVLKNYIDNSDEEYLGFAHYRRLPDLLNVSDVDQPSIYGIGYSESMELFDRLNSANLYDKCKNYDVIYPCSCYMYKNTVNPLLKSDMENFDVINHFKAEHNSDLLLVLSQVIKENYPEYSESLEKCFNSYKSHFYNIYIMKKELLKEFLAWQFDILGKIGIKIGGWNRNNYLRMAGFVGEALINIWLEYNNDLKCGYVPIYMIDFEYDYVKNINNYISKEDYKSALSELKNLLKVSSEKFHVLLTILNMCIKLNDYQILKKYYAEAKESVKSGEDYYQLATLLSDYPDFEQDEIYNLYENALTSESSIKLYAQGFLTYAQKNHNTEKIKTGWDYLSKFDMTEKELESKERFMKIYSML